MLPENLPPWSVGETRHGDAHHILLLHRSTRWLLAVAPMANANGLRIAATSLAGEAGPLPDQLILEALATYRESVVPLDPAGPVDCTTLARDRFHALLPLTGELLFDSPDPARPGSHWLDPATGRLRPAPPGT